MSLEMGGGHSELTVGNSIKVALRMEGAHVSVCTGCVVVFQQKGCKIQTPQGLKIPPVNMIDSIGGGRGVLMRC